MHKRGQIYLLVALVMSVIIFGMVTVSNKVGQDIFESDFEDLSQNYATESSKLINSLIGKDDVVGAFKNFTLLFTSYSKTQNPRFELIYAFDYNNSIYVGNYLRNRIFVCTDEMCTFPDHTYPPLEGCYNEVPATVGFDFLKLPIELYQQALAGDCNLTIDYSGGAPIDNLFITINEITYHFDIKKGRPEIIIVSWETKAEQRKVFTEGDFREGAGGGPTMTLSRYCRETCDSDYCTAPDPDTQICKARCGYIKTKDECDANSHETGGDCNWDEKLLDPCVNIG